MEPIKADEPMMAMIAMMDRRAVEWNKERELLAREIGELRGRVRSLEAAYMAALMEANDLRGMAGLELREINPWNVIQ